MKVLGMNIKSLNRKLNKKFVGRVTARLSDGCIVFTGELDDWNDVVDAGMTDLIRPALYQAYHCIENITSHLPVQEYDVVGPICESSDCFGKVVSLPETSRGDLIAVRSAGAYGEIMASAYNCRTLPQAYTSEELV